MTQNATLHFEGSLQEGDWLVCSWILRLSPSDSSTAHGGQEAFPNPIRSEVALGQESLVGAGVAQRGTEGS